MDDHGHPQFADHYRRFLGIDGLDLPPGPIVVPTPRRLEPICRTRFDPILATMWEGRLVVSVDPALEAATRDAVEAGRHESLTDSLIADLDDVLFETKPPLSWPQRMLRMTVDRDRLGKPHAFARARALTVEERDRAIHVQPGLVRGRRVLEDRWRWLEPQIREGRYFAVVEEGEVASFAHVSDVRQGGGNIAVGTNAKYRRKGFASAVVAAAATWCLEHDVVPIYLVDVRNKPSVQLAGSLGFLRAAEEIDVTVRR